jgi:hypothetical protein
MQIKTYITKNIGLLPNGVPKKRLVDIPDAPECLLYALESIFHYGQNEVQVKDAPSLSVGDTIIYEDDAYLILAEGFFCLTTGELIDG